MIRAIPPAGPLNAVVQVPGSKSMTNRALVCSALAAGTSRILNASESDDTRLMTNGLNQLGVLVRVEGDVMHVEGTGGRLFAPRYPIPVGNAGTTLRFLCSLAALAAGTTVFTTDARMSERPMDELLDVLRALGAKAERDQRVSSISIGGGGLAGGRIAVPTGKSSQFLSSLLLAAPFARGELSIEAPDEIVSLPYLEMTIEVMRRFGVTVQRPDTRTFVCPPKVRYIPASFEVEPDASGASYFCAAAAIAGGTVTVRGLRRRSMQGDAGFPDLLEQMGCTVSLSTAGLSVSGGAALQGIDADMNAMPDLVPTLAVVALFSIGATRIRNVAHLRHKESDRLAALSAELRRVGAGIELHEDGLEIHPGRYRSAQFDTHEDHRLAMSLALIGLRVPGVSIENPDVVRKSFPGFWREFEKLS